MPRGRQYYDPEIQVNRPVEAPADLARIEFYPELDGSGQIGRWLARRIDHDGRIVDYTAGNFDHDAELAHAQELWPDLTVYELPDEQTDSTWDGTGPSPRLWQQTTAEESPSAPVVPLFSVDDPLPEGEQMPLRVIAVERPGTYVLLEDIRALLEVWAMSYDEVKNPSGAVALREALEALKEIG